MISQSHSVTKSQHWPVDRLGAPALDAEELMAATLHRAGRENFTGFPFSSLCGVCYAPMKSSYYGQHRVTAGNS